MTNVISSLHVLDRQSLEERDYWLGRLSPYKALPALPRDPLQPWRKGAGVLRFAAGPALSEGLARLTGGSPFLLYVTALAALKITLYRYTGNNSPAVGSPPRRQNSGARLSNALVIVDEIDGAQPFRDFLLGVRRNLLDAYSRQRYPFDLLLRDLGLEWNGDGPPLFDVALKLDGIHDDLPDLGDRSQPITIELGQEESQEKGKLTGTVRFDPARYRLETIGRFVQHFLRVLESACASTAVPVGELAMLTEAEKHAALREWNDTATDFPREATVPELFARQAAARPDAVALAFGDERLTYRELDRRAERLARRLRALGVGPETLVALLAERSLEMVVALLGVLKAGAGYLPIDPTMPGERLAFLLKDARPAVILAQERLAGVLPEAAAPVVLLDAFDTTEAGEPACDLPEVAPESLAYVMYTSGSTGKPKGVAVPHRAVIRLVRDTNLCHFGPEETCLQAAQISFDASTLEIWGALLNGGKVALLQGNAGSLDDVCDEVARHGATTLFLTAGMFHQMVTHRVEALRPVRQVFSGGDVMPPAAARRAVAELPGTRLANGYGPTENTGLTCRHVLSAADDGEAGVPIGRPLSNTQVYLLDRDGQPVPIGFPGELLAGGDGLARGYLGRPDLTAERWVPDPTGERPGARLYRTGDQARYLPDGRLEFLGRHDHQVKIRGFRIELGEVEAALRSHPAVRDAAVVARKGETGEQRLVAYVATGPAPGLEVKELRAFLHARLPEYMVPPVLLFLAELPLTPLGKVDRAALPEPGDVAMPATTAEEPRTLAEELVAGIYADVLGVSGMAGVGPHDDFFALGGHSLLATQVISRIRSAFQVDLPLRALFDSPTVAALAAAVESTRDGGQGPGVPPIAPVPRDGLLPLSFAQQRLWFVDLLEPGGWAYNIPFVLGLEGALDTRALRWSLDEVVRRHEALRTTFAQAAGQAVQVISPPRAGVLPVADLTALPEPARDREARRLAREDARRPFNLTAGPLFRATLVRLAEEHHALLVNLHHIISDGWSMGVLARELGALYRTARAGRPSPLPELPVQYADFAWWQRQWLSGEVLETRLGYWRQRLAGAPPTLELPTDRPRPASRSGRGGALSFTLGRELSDRVLALGRGESATLSMLEVATFQALLSRYTRSEDVVLGTTIAGRPTLETEGLIGYFINTLVLRTDLTGDPSFRELLARVREVSIDAHAHEEIPFDKLIEELAPERSAGITPLVQVMLTTLNAPQDALDLPGMKIRPWGGDNDTAKFDLTLVMGESEQGLTGTFEYSSDLFDRTTVQRLAGHFRNLIAAAVAAPGAPLSSLPLLGEAESHLVRREWNATGTAYPRESNLFALFEEVAAASPDAPAVESADGSVVTYGDLLRRSRQLAHRLRMYGVGPEMPVGLCVERAVDLAVGTLGIVAAGGTYVPLDPSYPAERLGWMVEDTGLIILVADERLMSALPGGVATAGLLEVLLDEDDLGRESDGPVENLSGPGHLAYVMYTSGSTGQPKGVAVEQRGILRLVRDTDYVSFGPADRIGQVSNTSFDAATFEIWGAFLGGGCLVEVPRDTLLSPRLFATYLRERRITTMFLTAALFTQVAGEVPDAFGAMRQLLVGGDAVDPGRARAVLAQGPPERLINGYGPTEGTTFTVCHWIAAVAPEASNVPIGRPIANSRAYLLDKSLRPVPVGVPGELYAAGDGLARGYLNRPDATAERFPPAPDLEAPGARLYRTGDLARWLPDGVIEFLGRVDNQVKIRGFRIEPGEVETALSQLAGVRQAAVVVRQDLAVGKALVGYAVLEDPDHGPTSADLRDELRRKLPDYMVPSFIAILPELPMSPNGKVDRLALPAPALEEGRRYIAPRTPEQQALAAIWSEVLGVERVSLDDDFFALGGHSLLATQVISRARTTFGVDLPLRVLFETPTLEAVTEGLLLEIQAGQQDLSPGIEPAPRDGRPLPLSFSQQRLWILEQMEIAGAAYNMPAALRLRGRLDAGVLERSLGEVVRRHEVLRTTFATVDGEAAQIVGPLQPLPLPRIDLAGLPDASRAAETARLAREDALRPFDLGRGPLVRATLLRLGEDEHVALFNLHHIVSDGWSVGVLVGELSALYRAFAEGQGSPLPELPIQYADFAVWQRGWLQGEVLEEQLAYWRGRLIGASPLDLPTDRPRPAQPSVRGASLDLALSPALSRSLADLALAQDATLYMVLLAAWTALLHRYTGQFDIVVGTPIANRNRPETEPLIGFFVNTLALRTDLGGDPPFRGLLERVRETALGAYAHQDLPFEKLVEELQPERDLSRTPLFQVMFALQNAPRQDLQLPGLALEQLEVALPTAKFDWSLALAETENGIRGELEYRTELFEEPTMLRAIEHFRLLLEGVAADPGAPVSELPLLSAAERAQLLLGWNDTAVPREIDRCLHELVEEQAARTPDAPALLFGGEQLTYRELDARANRLAAHLESLGASPEQVVGLHVERSFAMVVGMIGILKAGAAWLPLDPSYPRQRLAYMLEDAGARILLTQRGLDLPAAGVETVDLDDLPQAGYEDNRPATRAMPDNLACVIYTSGSTGRPKGVALPHRGLANRLLWAQERYQLTAADTVLFKAPFGFDFSIWECFGPLLAGARVLVAEPGGHQNTAYLVRTIAERGVTLVHFVPSLLGLFLGEPGVEECRSLRQVFAGGEAFSPELRERFFSRLSVPVDNQYGPTEISIDTVCWRLEPGQDPLRVPIGRPIDNTQAHVLDRGWQPVPIGIVGELCIGGPGVARGYLGRPDLTAERFLPDPLGAGGRIYRTGDLARRLPDGVLEFLGRADQQVKLRGVRIEPGEIEDVLMQHPEIAAAAVVVAADRFRLIACVVPRDPSWEPRPAEMRPFLRERLTDAMIPASYVRLDELPRTPSGKLDRRALAGLEGETARPAEVAPRTPVEETLAAVWSEMLGRDRVGIHDNFFDLGGHSLLATRVVSRIRDVLRVELSLRTLFEAATVAQLAREVEKGLQAGNALAAPAIQPVSRDQDLPLSFAQQRLWFLDQLEPESSAYNVPMALRLRGRLDPAALAASFGEIAARHEVLRTTFATAPSGEPVQRIAPARPLALPLVDLAELPEAAREAEARRLATALSRLPFDLARGPLLRIALLRLADEEHAALLSIHHIISDAWSTGVLIRELTALYPAFLAGRPSPLPPLPVQYADFAFWQRSWLQGEVLEEQVRYWRERLAGAPPVLELPLDRPRPAAVSGRGGLLGGPLPARLTAPVAALGRREGATRFMTLLAAWKALLHRYSGEADLMVGTPIANRHRAEVEDLIGFFVNTLVLRTAADGGMSFRELLHRVRDGAFSAYAHQDLPFERLIEELAPERSLAYAPLFQVMFVLQDRPATTLALPGVGLAPFDFPASTAKFDLTLFIQETAQGLWGQVEYSSDLFDGATALRMLEHLGVLLEAAVAEPERPLSELPLLPAPERHQVLVEWNEPVYAPASPVPVHRRFEEQAAAAPDLTALIDGERHLSYGELDRRAGRLAAHLRSLGVGPDVPVGICLERGWRLAVSLLAALKAGGCYLPLDPHYPAERLAFMVANSGTPVLITAPSLTGLFEHQAQVVFFDDLDGFDGEERGSDPPFGRVETDPDHLSYVVYTSGSTGWPKGVALPHRTLSILIDWQLTDTVLQPGSGARTLQFASPSFDVSLQEIFSTWAAGGTLVVPSLEQRRDPESLARLLRDAHIERLFLPYVALQQLAEAFVRTYDGSPCCLREIQTAGEQLLVTQEIRDFFRAVPGCILYNHYGPSETHVVTSHTLPTGQPWPTLPPIGRPLPTTSTYLLDRRQLPVPAGVPGELYLGGAMLARGYLGRPDLTAERFVPDPWSATPGGRLYRTGDLARYQPTGAAGQPGSIEYLGRTDHQVKIRGFRVEPGEIEVALGAHPAVREAVVVVKGEGTARHLAALVLAADSAVPDLPDALRSYLRERLPDFMVPAAFTALDSFPLTPSGKVDRLALARRTPSAGPAAAAPVWRALRTLAEEMVAGIWAEVLHHGDAGDVPGIAGIGADDNFFDLGGHSLLATQVMSRLRALAGVDLPLRALFEEPTVAGLARRLEAARGEGQLQAPPIARAERQGPLPLSFAQERLWFLDQLEPGSAVYNLPNAFRVAGPFSPALFAAVAREIVRRHEVLRSRLAQVDGRPVQEPSLAGADLPVPLVDLSGLPLPARTAELDRLVDGEARRPFDLASGPLLRASVVALGAEDHAALVNMHHAASDGWSLGVFVRELTALYDAFGAGRPSPLPELPIQYADFAAWQRSWLDGEVLEAQVEHWRGALAGAPHRLHLPADRPRPLVASQRGGLYSFRLPAELTGGLVALGRRQGSTLFMSLLAGLSALLSRATGEEDLLVGSPIAGRNRREVEDLIGFFVNTLVLRADLTGDPSFQEVLGRVRERTLSAYAHQDLPFEKLVEKLEPERDLAWSPLFQVLLTLQNAPAGDLSVSGAALTPLVSGAHTAKFDLSLTFQESGQELIGAVSYASDLFDPLTIERLTGHLRNLLAASVEDPWARLSELPLISAAERAQLLGEWNATGRALPGADRALHELFEAQVERSPEAVAVAFAGVELTYRQLNARANRWARHLRRQGVGPEVPVALRLERSTEMVVALLAVLKSGGAYAPLDPAWPQARLDMALEDLGDPVLLTQEILREEPPGADVGDGGDDENLESWTDPDHLAYAIFTSGSTGRPKGAMNSHRGVVNRLLWGQQAYGLAADDRVLQKTPYSFDVSVWEFFWPLLTGARLVVALPGGHQDPAYLIDTIVEQGITTAHFVPSMLQVFARAEGIERCASLRRILCSGEELPLDLVRLVTSRLQVPVHNLYGPTEAAVEVTHWTWQDDPELRAVPIGIPVANVQIHLWDRHGNLVPAGVAGELCIGGVQVARGYHRRPELTTEKFVPDPFSGIPGARLYRTGDLARRRHDGQIEFLRRIDFQVKIRGVRIELGEVETAVRQHPGVAEAVALVQEDAAGDKRLVAYLVVREASEGADRALIDSLRQELAAKLPAAMVPAAFVTLDALPLTASGKTDRLALARLKPAFESRSAADWRAPRTPLEELLANVWAEVLHRDEAAGIGVDDNFFELGGHSLLATQVISRLRPLLGFDVPLRSLFQEPTIAGLARLLEAAQRGQEPSSQVPPLVRAERQGPLPLSFAQERLWFLDQLQPDSPAYNIPISQYLAGPLGPAALAGAFTEIVRRHEVLRTVYAATEGEPVQVGMPTEVFLLPVLDLSGLPGSLRRDEASRLARLEAGRPFDLARDRMLRASLVRLAAEEHVVLATMHHIASDGWSMGILLREMQLLYEACRQGLPVPLGELPVQYGDYAVWQRGWLQGETLAAELDYWRERLAGAPPLLELPLDRPRPAIQSLRGGSIDFALSPQVSAALKALARQQGATLFMVLLAGWQVLLARYSGQEDVSVGTPIAGRTRSEIEGLIGFFVNTLVMRAQLSGEPGFAELVAQVRERSLEAHLHQNVPFETLVEELAPERSLSHSPLFQAMFALQNTPQARLEMTGLAASPFGVAAATEKFDLTLNLAEDQKGVSGALSYSTDLFDGTTARRLLGHFQGLVKAMAERPDEPVWRVPLLGRAEREQILSAWNATHVDHPGELRVHDLVQEQAERDPEALAVVSAEERLTYGELCALASRLALRLRGLGIGPETVVGLCARRSPAMVVGMLAVMKAGGAYLPLDPDYPRERVALLLQDAGARLVLTESGAEAALASWEGSRLRLDLPGPDTLASAPASETATGAEGLAYVIYTSGSTGRPKGVAVPHRGLVNLVLWHRHAYSLTSRQRTTQLASPAFDASAWEIWSCLASGATLYLPDEETRSDPGRLLAWLATSGIEICFLPTPLAEELMALEMPAQLGLRALLTGGDALRRAPESGVPFRLFNHYGPTESTVVATSCEVEASWSALPPIGMPIANTRAYVVDRQGEPVPVGVPGELLIGGIGVARGYLGRPELTADRFVPDPFAGRGARLYRTGDLVRWWADGQLAFLGRLDHQVKVRGFRIELGEIEAALTEDAQVQDAVVLVLGEESGRRLAAFVVPREGAAPSAPRLRSALAERLPGYMVPATFSFLPSLPLTPNGKVDRRALAALEVPGRSEPDAGREGPRTPVEEIVAGAWAEVLGHDRISSHDSFFDLGGHSLLATRVISRLRGAFGIDLPLRELFEAPTVAGLAGRIEAAMREAAQAFAPPLVPAERSGPLPLSFAQERLWFLEQLEPGTALYNLPSAFRVTGPLDPGVFAAVIREIARRHEVLRTRFRLLDEQPVQEVAEVGLPVPVLDLSGLPAAGREAELRRLVTEEARRPFDLSAAPLLRASVVPLGPEEHAVLVTVHHIAFDGWSMGIFVRELSALYEAFEASRPSPLPELPVQYADFAAWQRSWLTAEALDAEVEHWRQALAGAPQRLQLPTDRPRPMVASRRGASVPFLLPPELSSALAALGRRQGTTLFMTLLAGFSALLSRYTGEEDLLVGTPIAGRNHREIEGLVGFFVNTLVLRADLGGDPGFQEILGRVRETTLAAYAHQDLPFEKLVDELAPERDLSWSALFQVMLSLQNAPAGELSLSRLRLSPLLPEADLAKFDLLLSLQESGKALGGAMTYATDLFDRSTVQRLLEHLTHLLQGAVGAPATPLSELPLISAAERAHLLLEWNDTGRVYAQADLCVHELFEIQVERSPEAVALTFEGRHLTYRELNTRANQLARYLRRHGVGPDVRVALGLERSFDMVIAIVAVLKAGGVYAPLDPAAPRPRLALMLEEIGAPVLLTRDGSLDDLPGVEVIDLEDDRKAIAKERGDDLENLAQPDNLAYLINTSGSTGKPKAVLNTHRGTVNRLLWGQESYPIAPDDRVLKKTPYIFDFSVWEIFATLIHGARLVIAVPGGHQDPQYMVDTILEQGITTVHFVPSMLQLFARTRGLERCTTLRRIFCGGEELAPESVRLVAAQLDVQIFNQYGPCEAAVDITYWPCDPERALRGVPVGRPTPNVRIYLLDRAFRPVPLGLPGELYVAGDQLGRGYLGRPDLTAERFGPDPFSAVPGARLYRTGDLTRYLKDGQIEFLRRIDSQVKVRGIRIELGEIESLARQHPGVAEAVAMVREDNVAGMGDKRLVLYVLVASDQAAAPEPGPSLADSLRDWLTAHLPAYMVPGYVVALAALPRTASGKVDRLSLPAPDSSHRAEEQGYIAPRDILELRLARIWEDSLGVTRVGAKDNFFELGGHSLLAVGVVERMGRLLGRRIPVGQLFQTPRLEDLARYLRNDAPPAPISPLVRIQPDGGLPPLFWVHPVGGNVLCYASLARHLGTGQPFYAFQAPGIEGEREPLESVEALAARYVEEMLAARPDGPYHLGGWSFGGVVAFEMARQLQAAGREVATLCLLDSRNPARREPEAAPDERALVHAFAQDIGLSLEGLNVAGGGLPRQTQSEDLASLLEEARRAGIVPADFSLQRVEALFRVFRANRQASRHYVPQPLDGDLRIHLLRAEEQLGPDSRLSEDPALGWEGMAAGGVEVHPVAGNHYTALHEPHVQAVAEQVAAGTRLR